MGLGAMAQVVLKTCKSLLGGQQLKVQGGVQCQKDPLLQETQSVVYLTSVIANSTSPSTSLL